ncbi:TPA: glycosyltransferase family 52 [Escherichia coli]
MNVFICFTPFQLFLSLEIVKLENLPPSRCIFFLYNYHDRFKVKKNYIEVTKGFEQVYYESRPLTLAFIFKLRSIAKQIGQVKTAYLASIDNNIAHYLLSFLKPLSIRTFDDGTANITQMSLFYRDIKTNPLKAALHLLLGRKYNREKIKSASDLHYTVYRGVNNITDKIEILEMLRENTSDVENRKVLKIMLGSIYSELVDCSEDEVYIQNYIHRQCIDEEMLYIPHPREDLSRINVPFVSDWRISEQIIVDFISCGYEVYLYGFPSSTFFNLSSNAHVKCCIFMTDKLREEFKDLIKIAKSLNMSITNIPTGSFK